MSGTPRMIARIGAALLAKLGSIIAVIASAAFLHLSPEGEHKAAHDQRSGAAKPGLRALRIGLPATASIRSSGLPMSDGSCIARLRL